jgi:hypothetical protein
MSATNAATNSPASNASGEEALVDAALAAFFTAYQEAGATQEPAETFAATVAPPREQRCFSTQSATCSPPPQGRIESTKRSARRGYRPRLFTCCCAAVAVLCFAGVALPSWIRPVPFGAGNRGVWFKRIDQIEIFDRVVGSNPLLSDQDRAVPDPDPATWRVLRLRMIKSSGKLLKAKLARPLSWIKKAGAEEGRSFYLNLPEMGAVGEAEVLAIEPCPSLKPGKGNVVTGTFAHEADDTLVMLQLSEGVAPIGVTDNHPFWSEDRKAFIAVGRLRRGERVRTLSGVAEVVGITKRPVKPGEIVYNLEVHGEHVYHVGYAGVLVHNQCIGLGLDDRLSDLRGSGATTYESWNAKGLTRVDPIQANLDPFQFQRSFTEAANNASRIHFDLTGLDIPRALREGSSGFVRNNYTNAELFQILNNPSWLQKTEFYLNGQRMRFGNGRFVPFVP